MLSYQDGDLIISDIRSRIHIEVHVVELSATRGLATAKRSWNHKRSVGHVLFAAPFCLIMTRECPATLMLRQRRRDGQASHETTD